MPSRTIRVSRMTLWFTSFHSVTFFDICHLSSLKIKLVSVEGIEPSPHVPKTRTLPLRHTEMVLSTRIELVMTGYQPIVIPFNYKRILAEDGGVEPHPISQDLVFKASRRTNPAASSSITWYPWSDSNRQPTPFERIRTTN